MLHLLGQVTFTSFELDAVNRIKANDRRQGWVFSQRDRKHWLRQKAPLVYGRDFRLCGQCFWNSMAAGEMFRTYYRLASTM